MRQSAELSASLVFAVASVAVESGLRMSPGGGRKVKRPWAHNLLGRDVPTRTADPVGTKYVEGFGHARSQVPTTTGMVKVGLRSGPIAQHSNIRE